MSVIRILPEHVANKIAAGEVVERPASVTKELVENSLDAGGRQVEVHIESGGKRLIRVADDGCGMSRDDAMLAFERHATSKIRSADDLDEISTLGFRGEALPSIAAVSRLTLETRLASEPVGTQVEFAGGRLRDVREVVRPAGTKVEVANLFYNTPARRKFLKSESTELGHIVSLVTHYALAHPDKAFQLTSVTNEILKAPPVANHRERLYQVMGGQLLEQLVEFGPVERRMPAFNNPDVQEEEPAEPTDSVFRIFGFVSRPEVQKLNRNQIYFFVNRRLIRDRLILHALTEAYRNILPAGVFPVALIFLDMPAGDVDVNVHPSKAEVRFRNSSFVHDLVRDSIRQSLMAARPIAAFPLPKQVQAASQIENAEVTEKIAEAVPAAENPGARANDPLPNRTEGSAFRLISPRPLPSTRYLPLAEAALATYAPLPAGPGSDYSTERPATGPESHSGELPADLQPLGQVHASFIVATNAEGLWLVDQHVAHERILFEQRLRGRREKKLEGQRLLLPIVVDLRPEQRVTFQSVAEELAANGFEVEPFGQGSVAVKAAPADIQPGDVEKLVREILDSVGQEARALSLDELRRKIAASVACHAAIKVNMPLDREKMDWLLHELSATEYPMTCPHGRPVVLRYSMKEIQKAFKRI